MTDLAGVFAAPAQKTRRRLLTRRFDAVACRPNG